MGSDSAMGYHAAGVFPAARLITGEQAMGPKHSPGRFTWSVVQSRLGQSFNTWPYWSRARCIAHSLLHEAYSELHMRLGAPRHSIGGSHCLLQDRHLVLRILYRHKPANRWPWSVHARGAEEVLLACSPLALIFHAWHALEEQAVKSGNKDGCDDGPWLWSKSSWVLKQAR